MALVIRAVEVDTVPARSMEDLGSESLAWLLGKTIIVGGVSICQTDVLHSLVCKTRCVECTGIIA